MNMRTLQWAGFVTIFFVVCAESTLPETVIALFVMGMIPGTDTTIPAGVMLVMYPILFLLALWWISSQPFFIGERVSTTAKPTPVPTKKRHAAKTKTAIRRKTTPAKHRPRAAV